MSLPESLSRSDHSLLVDDDLAALINLLSFVFGSMLLSLPDEPLADHTLLFNRWSGMFSSFLLSLTVMFFSGEPCLELLDDEKS